MEENKCGNEMEGTRRFLVAFLDWGMDFIFANSRNGEERRGIDWQLSSVPESSIRKIELLGRNSIRDVEEESEYYLLIGNWPRRRG